MPGQAEELRMPDERRLCRASRIREALRRRLALAAGTCRSDRDCNEGTCQAGKCVVAKSEPPPVSSDCMDNCDIPLDVNDEVIACTRRFQSPAVRPDFVRWLSRSHRFLPRFRAILHEQGLPEDLADVAMIESGLEPRGEPCAGRRDLAVHPFDRQAVRPAPRSVGGRAERDPEKAARAAARFLEKLYAQTADWYLALAAYNSGPGRISRSLKDGYGSFWEMARSPSVLPRETRAYVPSVLAAAIVARPPGAFGFREEEIERHTWIEYENVRIPRASSLTVLARAAGTSVEELRDLNPELRRGSTPPRPPALKIPRQRKAAFAARWPRLAAQAHAAVVRNRVKPGDSLWSLSRQLGVTVQELARWNGTPSRERHLLQAGRFLRVSPPAGVLDAAWERGVID